MSVDETCTFEDKSSVVLGQNVSIGAGTSIGHGCYLHSCVTIGANVVMEPRVVCMASVEKPVVIEDNVTIGTRATITPGVRIGGGAIIRAGAVVTKNVETKTVVEGNPATLVAFLDAPIPKYVTECIEVDTPEIHVEGVSLIKFPRHTDHRGSLVYGQYEDHLPWAPQRFFYVYDVPAREHRGYHGHRTCEELLVCTHGKVSVLVDDGDRRATIVLSNPQIGLLIEPFVWISQHYELENSQLLVLCSETHSPEKYIHDYSVITARAEMRKQKANKE